LRAVVKTKPEPGVEVLDVDTPEVGMGDVLIRIKASAICGSDLGIYDFTPAYAGMGLPVIPGHEFSGVVEEVGPGVEEYSVGDRVLSRSVVSCGSCRFCTIGMDNLCVSSRVLGIHRDGGFAEYVSVPQGLLHRVPDSMSYDEAALVEPLSNALHFVNDITPVEPGDLAVVLGIGPIGLFSAQLFRLAGAEVLVTGISVDTERFRIAEALGLEAVNVDVVDPVEMVMERTSGRGADVALVAVGAPSAMVQAVEMVGKRGRVTVVGIFPGGVALDWTSVVRREVALSGAYDARAANFPKSIELIGSGKIKATELVTHRLPLEKADEAFGAAKSKAGCKVLFVP